MAVRWEDIDIKRELGISCADTCLQGEKLVKHQTKQGENLEVSEGWS